MNTRIQNRTTDVCASKNTLKTPLGPFLKGGGVSKNPHSIGFLGTPPPPWMGSLMGTGDGANAQHNMARVLHGYLVSCHLGEEHLILSAILAADLLTVHTGRLPTVCEAMCGKAGKQKKNTKQTVLTRETSKGTTLPLQPVGKSRICLFFDLEHDERVVLVRGCVPQLPQCPP